MGDARFVIGRRARWTPRAFWKDDELAPRRDRRFGALAQKSQRVASRLAALHGKHRALDQIPAEEGDEHQLLFQDESRVLEHGEEREGLPGRLMLGGDETTPFRQLLEA